MEVFILNIPGPLSMLIAIVKFTKQGSVLYPGFIFVDLHTLQGSLILESNPVYSEYAVLC